MTLILKICLVGTYILFAFVTLDLFWWANQNWYFARVLYPLCVGSLWVFIKMAEDSI
jgi:hypothetical protein